MPTTARLPARRSRRRNSRGEGARLADEIVAGALAIIERTGSDEAVTLRSVAREVGIAAPSIYAHFADRDAILWAVVLQVFDELAQVVRAAADSVADGVADPVERMVAGCRAYVRFGLERSARYRVLFARELPSESSRPAAAVRSEGLDSRLPPVGAEAFLLLVEEIERCVALRRSASVDPFADATALWVALHGMVSLSSVMCEFPWPAPDDLVRRLVISLARIAS